MNLVAAAAALALAAAPAKPAAKAAPPPAAPVAAAPPAVEVPPPEAISVVALQGGGKVFTGVVVSELGLVLTRASAVATRAPLQAVLLDGRRVPVSTLQVDAARDLALVRLLAPGVYVPIGLASRMPKQGAPVELIANPGSLGWSWSDASVAERHSTSDGKLDTTGLTLTPKRAVEGPGGAVLDGERRLVGLMGAVSADGTSLAAVGLEAIRPFLSKVGVALPLFEVEVGAEPQGAQLFIDGRPIARLTEAPTVVGKLTAGHHELRLVLDGHADDLFGIDLLEHKRETLHRKLDVGAEVEVAAETQADLWVDGAYRGASPQLLKLPGGRHTVEASAPGFASASELFEVAPGARAAVNLKLERLTAQLSVATVPPGAAVTVDGVELGPTPLVEATVPAGKVLVGVKLEGRHAYTFPLTLVPKEKRALGPYTLEAPHGWVEANVPGGTLVSIDGKPRQSVGRHLKLSEGQHELRLYAPGYWRLTEKVSVADGQTLALDPALALYDRMPARRAVGFGLGGLGFGLGLVTIGMLTDDSTRPWSLLALGGAVASLTASLVFLLTAPSQDEGGWDDDRTWSPPKGTP